MEEVVPNVLDLTRPKKKYKYYYPKTDEQREKIALYNIKYRTLHSTKIECPCGSKFVETSKYNHINSLRHIKWTEQHSKSSAEQPAE